MIVLVCGLPGSGKSWLAERLCEGQPNFVHLDADMIREAVQDWDFSEEARLRQALRMRGLAYCEAMFDGIAIADFVCPTPETRKLFDADYTIFLDTIDISRYSDTNKVFVKPDNADFIIKEQLHESAVDLIRKRILNARQIGKYNFRKPT
jgi:adenylylsulfate kinase